MSEFSIDLSTVVEKPCNRASRSIPHTAHIYLSAKLPEDTLDGAFYAKCDGVPEPPEPTVDQDFNTFLRIRQMGMAELQQGENMRTLMRLADLGIKARELLADEEALGNAIFPVLRSFTETEEGCEAASQWAAGAVSRLAAERGLQ